jgi:copper chaperone CopZ
VSLFKKSPKGKIREYVINVDGMSCKRCASKVSNALYAVDGVKEVAVDIAEKKVTVTGACDLDTAKKAVKKAGYAVTGDRKSDN